MQGDGIKRRVDAASGQQRGEGGGEAQRVAGLGIPGLMQKVDGVAGTLRLGENDDGGTSVRVAVPVAAVRP